MRYKMLLTGRNKSVIDDFFNQADGDEFEVMTTSTRYVDVVRHMRYFEPDIIVYCIYNESVDSFNQIATIRPQLNQHQIPFIIIGSREDCDEFERITYHMQNLVLVKPLTADAIMMQILKFMDVWNKRKKTEAEVHEKLQLFYDEEDTLANSMDSPEPDVQTQLFQNHESAFTGRKHILVVDDSPIMLKTLKENLREDYDVATAINGKIAMKFLERKKTDLVLLDYEMPGENGPVVLEKIRAREDIKDIPVIFLTGVTDSGKIREALVLKPQGYLLKPINREKLLEAITRVLG